MDITNRVKQRQSDIINIDFNERHRKYGSKLYGIDIDMIEYNSKCEPKILHETKHGATKQIDLNSFQIRCQRKTANLLKIPYLIVLYFFPGENKYTGVLDPFGKMHKYGVIPANEIALNLFDGSYQCKLFTEYGFVKLLYSIKNEYMPDDLDLDNLIDIEPATPILQNRFKIIEDM